ncbi:hypothetical protein G7Z17_g3112 [Cylindrodendrum hubeiense]|uniref:Uncharacterized protein n=1 Tax=Cylindrodendrum hubeiense TaxID=595255 RepID=A0A9P5HBI4_9HYPO|nr:hypothetical protein G7Z17_g3112 [Cylindrodendrum hubeiense]
MTKSRPRTVNAEETPQTQYPQINNGIPTAPIGHDLAAAQAVERAVADNAENAGRLQALGWISPAFWVQLGGLGGSMANSAAQRKQSGGTANRERDTRLAISALAVANGCASRKLRLAAVRSGSLSGRSSPLPLYFFRSASALRH